MAQQLRALAAVPEDLGLVLGTSMAAHICNSSLRGCHTLFRALWYSHTHGTETHM